MKSKKRKLWIFSKYFAYLEEKGCAKTGSIAFDDVHHYINSLSDLAPSTICLQKSVLRGIYDWMYRQKYVPYSGRQMFPLIRKSSHNRMLSYYSKEEIRKILSNIDTDTSSGKFAFCILCLLSYLGMRIGDVIHLRFSDIDWNVGRIHYTQGKTGNPLSLPLLDEVKYSLLDYIKNVRHESSDHEFVFVTMYAPYTRYHNTSSMFHIIDQCMRTAGINYEGRHHGPHSLRHSLASNLMAENVPISAISNILGHTSTKTTEIYLTVDETHLKELSLEVPYV